MTELQVPTKLMKINCKVVPPSNRCLSLLWEIEELKSINTEGCRIHEDLMICTNFCTLSLFQ